VNTKTKQGLSRRGYAAHAGVSVSYVQKLITRGAIKLLPDGSIDAVAADAGRAKYTIIGKGQRKLERAKARKAARAEVRTITGLTCEACGALYRREHSAKTAAPNPDRFCCSDCQADTEAGMSAARIRRRRERGTVNDNAKRPVRPAYIPPPPLPQDLRTCLQCTGIYDLLDHDFPAADKTRFCNQDCQDDFFAGVDRMSTQQRIRMDFEGGIEPEELRTKSYLNYAHPRDGSQKP